MKGPLRITLRIAAILAVAALAGLLRWRAVSLLPPDFDEDDYLRAAQQYAGLIRSGDWAGFTQVNYRMEHPPLAKIIFGLSILPARDFPVIPDRPTSASPDAALPREPLTAARSAGALMGTLTALLLAGVNPLAGAMLAVHAFTIKYDSQVMLEAFPALTSLAMVLGYRQGRRPEAGRGWLAASAILLGLTAASKYLYCVAGIAVLADWYLEGRQDPRLFFRQALPWAGLALITFFAADPYLWPDPAGRLKESILYHAAYSAGASEVERAGFPFWQPLVWLNMSPAAWHPGVFVFAPDPFISLLAVFGLVRLWHKERVHALWLGIALLFLLLWPTKWPQYVVTLSAPLCLAAAEGTATIWAGARQFWKARRRVPAEIQAPADMRRALPWLIPGLVAFGLLTLFPLLFQFAVSLTDFNSASIRDGFQGGIWRAFSEGITGRLEPVAVTVPNRASQVNYTGLASYPPVLDYLTQRGILVFNVLWTLLSVGLQTLLGLGAALLLWQRGVRFSRFWRALFILPWAIPEMIGALMWLNVFSPETGWLALAVRAFGPHIPLGFLNGWEKSPSMWLLVLLIPALWYGFPLLMLAAGAGLKMVPREVFDAAAIDGANAWQTFRGVTWPLLAPLLVPAIIVRGIFAFNQFYLFQAFYIPESTLATLSYNLFNPSGYGMGGQFALSAVINILTVLILTGFVAVFSRWSRAAQGLEYA
jgi:ABC-type sugar transport system permease subunit